MARAGKVAITPKGTFENGKVYEKLDSVEYNGTLYIAKKASAGILPTDTEYWMLAVDLTGKMDTTGDSQNNIVTFTSADVTDPTGWQDVQVLTSKEKHASLFKKISTMMSNMRYMYKILGSTDISTLGTVTQAIANLNSNVGGIKGISSSAAITTQGQYALDAREKNASVNGTLANQIDVLNSNLTVDQINDSDKTILDIILEKAPQKTWNFYRTTLTNDAPAIEDWTYVYVVIPMGFDIFLVVARRYATTNYVYQRIIISGQWFDRWFRFEGKRI